MSLTNEELFSRDRTTWVVYALVGFFAYFEASLGPIVPFLRRELGFGFTVASLHFSGFAAGALVIGSFADRIAARYGRRVALWGGALLMAFAAIVMAAAAWPPLTIAAAFAMGCFGSLLLIMTQSILADSHGRWKTVAITESNVAASGCSMAASLVVGAAAAVGLGWRAAVMPPVLTLLVLFVLFKSESLGEARSASQNGDGTTALTASFWIYWVVLFLGVAAEWTVGFWGAEFMVAGLNLSPSGAATAMSLFFGAMLLGRAASSRLARRIDDRTLLVATLCAATTGSVVMWLSRAPVPGLAGLLITGLGLSGVYPVGLSAGVGTVPGAIDTAAARLGIAPGLAILVLPFVVGRLADAIGIVLSFGVVIPLLVGAASLIAVDRWSSNRRQEAAPASH